MISSSQQSAKDGHIIKPNPKGKLNIQLALEFESAWQVAIIFETLSEAETLKL